MGLCASTPDRKPRQQVLRKVVTSFAADVGDLVLTAPDVSVCSLLSPKLSAWVGYKAEETKSIKVEKVCFRITSHDQGYCDIDIFSGEYEGSWTWFEAGIVRGFPNDDANAVEDEVNARIREALKNREAPDDNPTVTMVQKPGTEKDVWHIHRNARASDDYKLHEVAWGTQVKDEREEIAVIDETGVGVGDGFVQSLETEDRIAVIARRRYPGWENYISKVEIELSYYVV